MRWTTVGALESVASAMEQEMAWSCGQSLLWILFDLYGWHLMPGICLSLQTWKMSKLTTDYKNLGMFEKGLALTFLVGISTWQHRQPVHKLRTRRKKQKQKPCLGSWNHPLGRLANILIRLHLYTWLAIGSHLMVRKAAENSTYLIYDHKG